MSNWRNVWDKMVPYLPIFDDRLIVVYEGPGLDIVDIKDLIPEEFIATTKLYKMRNNALFRETKAFAFLIRKILKERTRGHCFFAHSKGVTRNKSVAVDKWVEALHYYNLADLDKVDEQLGNYPFTGCFKRIGQPTIFPPNSPWHYSGSYYWFDIEKLVALRARKSVILHRYGAEAFPGRVVPSEEGGVIAFDDVQGSLYNTKYISELLATNGNL